MCSGEREGERVREREEGKERRILRERERKGERERDKKTTFQGAAHNCHLVNKTFFSVKFFDS